MGAVQSDYATVERLEIYNITCVPAHSPTRTPRGGIELHCGTHPQQHVYDTYHHGEKDYILTCTQLVPSYYSWQASHGVLPQGRQ